MLSDDPFRYIHREIFEFVLYFIKNIENYTTKTTLAFFLTVISHINKNVEKIRIIRQYDIYKRFQAHYRGHLSISLSYVGWK